MTFENILYKDDHYNLTTNSYKNSVKLIDTDCIDFIDPPELDLGKIFQSVVSQYELWSDKSEPLVKICGPKEIALNFNMDRDLLKDLDEYISFFNGIIEGNSKEIEIKGRFYMALHLIRMLPFRLSVSEDQAMFALASAIKELSIVLEMIKNLPNQNRVVKLSVEKENFGENKK